MTHRAAAKATTLAGNQTKPTFEKVDETTSRWFRQLLSGQGRALEDLEAKQEVDQLSMESRAPSVANHTLHDKLLRPHCSLQAWRSLKPLAGATVEAPTSLTSSGLSRPTWWTSRPWGRRCLAQVARCPLLDGVLQTSALAVQKENGEKHKMAKVPSPPQPRGVPTSGDQGGRQDTIQEPKPRASKMPR